MIILMKIKKNIIQSDCIFWSSIQNINRRMFWVGLGKTNALFNLINNQPDLYGAKYQYLINKREKVGLNHYDGPKALLDTQMICKMFIEVLKNTIQERNVKY